MFETLCNAFKTLSRVRKAKQNQDPAVPLQITDYEMTEHSIRDNFEKLFE